MTKRSDLWSQIDIALVLPIRGVGKNLHLAQLTGGTITAGSWAIAGQVEELTSNGRATSIVEGLSVLIRIKE